MWDILIITNHYTQINIQIQTLIEQSKLLYESHIGKDEGVYHIGIVEIKVKPCRNVEGIERLRGYKADAIFVENEWLMDFEAECRLITMCHRKGMIRNIELFEKILKGMFNTMYDYRKEMIKNIKKYVIRNNWVEKNYHIGDDYSKMLDKLYDELWDKDEITGNGKNYYDEENKCAVYVMDNLPLYFEAAREFNLLPLTQMSWEREHAAQHMDATIRCYLLRDCLEEACEEL